MMKEFKMKQQKRLLLVIVMLFWFSQYVYVPYQTPYLLSINVTPALVGTIIGAYGLTQFAFRMPIGILADIKKQHKVFILIGIFAAGTASVFRIYLPMANGFLIGNLLSGLASAMWISFMVLYSNYFSKEELEKSMGLIIGANNVGVLSGFILSTLCYERFGMEFLCALSVGAAILSFGLAMYLKDPFSSLHALPIRELILVYKDKRLILFSVLALMQQGILMSTCMSFTAQAAREIGASDGQIGICLIIYMIAAVLSSYFSTSAFAQRRGTKFWVPVASLGLFIYCIMLANLFSVGQLFGIQIFAGLLTGILFSYCTAEAMRDVPTQKKSTAMGYHQAIYAIGMTFMPVVAGNIVHRAGLAAAFYAGGAVAFLGFIMAICFYYLADKKEKAAN